MTLRRRLGMAALAAGVAALVAGSAGAAPRMTFTLHFDLLTPSGVVCAADAPGSTVRDTTSIFGRQFLTLTGDLGHAAITCTAPDGSRWRTTLQFARSVGHGPAFDGVAAWRPGARRMYLYVTSGADSLDRMQAPAIYRFTRLQGAASDRRIDQ